VVNNKRVHRLWRKEGLRVPYRKKKRPLRGIGANVGAMCPIRPNVVWGRNQVVAAMAGQEVNDRGEAKN
jgi:putative transposase